MIASCCLPHSQNADDEADEAAEGAQYPEAHGHFRFAPAFFFEMVVQGGDQEYFFAEPFFRGQL